MGASRRITVEIPEELLAKAQKASGAGITETVRTGLQLVAASMRLTACSRPKAKSDSNTLGRS